MAIFPFLERIAKRAMNANGVQSRFTETSIAKLHVYDAPGIGARNASVRGTRPAVVVLHGISSSASAYGPLIQRLRRKGRRVIAPDAPGHGHSEDPRTPLTPDSLLTSLTEALDQHIDEPAIVFGCSLGGAVAMGYALARPERVRGLMLASPAGAAMTSEELESFLAIFNLRSRTEASEFMARLYHRAPWYTPLIASEIKTLFARPVIRSFTRSIRAEHLMTQEQVGSLAMPVHLIWGRADKLMPASNLEFYRKSLPAHAVIEEPESIGHCPHLDDPERLAETIVRFAHKVESEGANAERR